MWPSTSQRRRGSPLSFGNAAGRRRELPGAGLVHVAMLPTVHGLFGSGVDV